MSSISDKNASVTVTAKTIEHEPAADVEAQVAGKSAAGENPNEKAGQGMGIAMVICTVVSLIFVFVLSRVHLVLPWIAFITINIATIVLSYILSSGCCCAMEYNLKSNVKKFAIATLISCSLSFILTIICMTDNIITQNIPSIALFYLAIALNALAIVFSCLFTFGRGCCA